MSIGDLLTSPRPEERGFQKKNVLKDINNTPGIIRAYEVLAKIYERLDRSEEKRRAEEGMPKDRGLRMRALIL